MGKNKKAFKKKNKVQDERIDGMNPKDLKQLRTAMRRVWSWSYPRRLAKERAVDEYGFPVCEKCQKRVPKLQVDHIRPCGEITDPGFLERLYCPSIKLQSLCPSCHRQKTRDDKEKGWK